jgi:hypothetical protein
MKGCVPKFSLIALAIAFASQARAQAPSVDPVSSGAPAAKPTASTAPAFSTAQSDSTDPTKNLPGAAVDNRIPALDPSGAMIRFNGQSWSASDNALFRSRFEKYLNTPEEMGTEEKEHRQILNQIIGLLDPNTFKPSTISEAYKLLARAATYRGDSRLSDTIANAIYSVWATKRLKTRLDEANRILEEENQRARYNLGVVADTRAGTQLRQTAQTGRPSAQAGANSQQPGGQTPPTAPPAPTPQSPTTPAPGGLPVSPLAPGGLPSAAPGTPTDQTSAANDLAAKATSRDNIKIAGYAEKLVSNSAAMKANSLKGSVSEAQAKIEYQSLLVQLFLQRRFHHVVIGCRFYRAIFSDGASKLEVPAESQAIFTKGTGLQATVSTIESATNELMRDVQTGAQAFHRLLEMGELRSASERLRDILLIGEFMPEVRTLPFERKRKVLAFVEKTNQLQAAFEVKDYTLASELISGPAGLKTIAKDFDATKPNALIETARNASRLHLAKARNAALSGNKTEFETSIQEAAKIWPNNPELTELASKAFGQSDQMAQALLELDQLIAQKNFKRIADEAGRFLAATHNAPTEKQNQLKEILNDYKSIEGSLAASKEMDRLGNAAGAWEAIDKVAEKFPDDIQLNQARALYTTKASDFVRSVQTAKEHERRAQMATSLAWYLKAQRLYPSSELADQAVQRMKAVLLQGAPVPPASN